MMILWIILAFLACVALALVAMVAAVMIRIYKELELDQGQK